MSTLTSSYSNAYSSIVFNRTATSDRASVGNVDQTNDVQKTKPLTSSDQLGEVGKTTAPQTTFVPQTESGSKSTDRQQQKPSYPEKSTDAGKPRSPSGDILDLSQNSVREPINEKDVLSLSTNGDSEKLQSENETLNTQLTPAEQEQVEKLRARDAEVRAHEAAHLAVAGQYAQGGAKYEYQTGPDGKKYAIGGSVSIDSGPVSGDPEATIRKAQQVRAAALAPGEPSNQDQRVAAAASQMEADARIQLSRERTEEAMSGSQNEDSVNMSSEKEPQEKDGVFSSESTVKSDAADSKSSFKSEASQSKEATFKSALDYAQELAEEASEENDDQDNFYSEIAIQYLMNESTFETPLSTFVAYA